MPNDKYEDEIRDILNRMDRFIPEGERPRREPPRRPAPGNDWLTSLKRRLYGFNSNSLMVWFILLALAAGLLHRIFPLLGGLLALGSVACLLGAILLPIISRRYGAPDRRWRGCVVDYNEPVRMRQPFSWRYLWWRIKSFFGWR